METIKDLQDCYNYINEGIKIRSRASHYECGERDTGYFTELMKSNKKKRLINILYINEDISFDQTNIMQEI